MAKFTQSFKGCPDGVLHPVTFAPGDECPAELVAAATAAGALAAPKQKKPKGDADKKPEGEGDKKPEGENAGEGDDPDQFKLPIGDGEDKPTE